MSVPNNPEKKLNTLVIPKSIYEQFSDKPFSILQLDCGQHILDPNRTRTIPWIFPSSGGKGQKCTDSSDVLI